MYSLYRDSAFLMLPTLKDILTQAVCRVDKITEKLGQLSRQGVLMVQVLFCQDPHRWLGGKGLPDALDREGQRLPRLWHKGRAVRTVDDTLESTSIRTGSEDKGRRFLQAGSILQHSWAWHLPRAGQPHQVASCPGSVVLEKLVPSRGMAEDRRL